MVDFTQKDNYNIDDLIEIVRLLRGKGGCPWDMEQTHKSLKSDFIEETCEAIEAIDLEDTELLKEELGDVLLQVVSIPVSSQTAEISNSTRFATEFAKNLSFVILTSLAMLSSEIPKMY